MTTDEKRSLVVIEDPWIALGGGAIAPKEDAESEKRFLERTEPLAEDARRYIAASVPENTRAAYESDWKLFAAWCANEGVPSAHAKPGAVLLYLASMLKRVHADGSPNPARVSTIERAYAGIAFSLRELKVDGWEERRRPTEIAKFLKGLKSAEGQDPMKKDAVSEDDLAKMILVLEGGHLRDVRDRAILLVGFHGAFRRSELVALDVKDVSMHAKGMRTWTRKSKTDQGAKGIFRGFVRQNNVNLCPVRAMNQWLHGAGIVSGPIFRPVEEIGAAVRAIERRLTAEMVATIVQRTANAAGLDATKYAGHSLRSGFVTEAYKKGKNVHAIMKQTGHKLVQTVHGYIRSESVFDDNATEGLFDESITKP